MAHRLRPALDGAAGGAKLPTMVHGDYKQANMFFRAAAGAEDADEVVVFDWQWTGPGVGATDLLYVCAMALHDEVAAHECLRDLARWTVWLGEADRRAWPRVRWSPTTASVCSGRTTRSSARRWTPA